MLHMLLGVCCLIVGSVHTPSGAPIAQASLVFSEGPKPAQTVTDAKGAFSVTVAPGRYDLTASAGGYATVTVNTGDINGDSRIDVVLEPANSPKLRTIGEVSVNGGYALVRNAIPEFDVSRNQMDALGYSDATEALQEVPSVILQRPDSGSPTAPSVVSLRGPDPSEAMVTLDGHLLNDANTGDLDISQFVVPAFNSISVTEGLGPADSEGSNTFGGAVNFVTLRPTQVDHAAISGSIGSYGTTQTWLNATGTAGKLGYAVAGDNYQSAGQVDQNAYVLPQNNVSANCSSSASSAAANCPVLTHLGSTISARLGLVNLDYAFSQRADAGFRTFTLANNRDESSALNGIAGNLYQPCDPTDASVHCTTGNTGVLNPVFGDHVGAGSAIFAQNVRAYDAYSRSVLGSGSLLADFFASDNGVSFSGGSTGVTPYDVSHLDKRYEENVSWGRTFDQSDYAFGGSLRQESLTGEGIAGPLEATIQQYFLRGAQQFGNLRLSAGLYDANYSTFGSSVDWRFGASYDLGSDSVVRASAGTGFRPPLLIEQYYFPEVIVSGKVEPNPGLPPADANCVVAGQGNPSEKSEHATEYEFGFSHAFSTQSNLDVSLYRSNLRDTIENFYPGYSCNAPNGFAYEIPINIGNAVYEGAEVRFKQGFPRQHLAMQLSYGLNVAYPFSLGPNVSNPTSGGNLVPYEQFLGVPQQQASATLTWADKGWHAAAAFTFTGNNNPLGQGAYTFTDGAVGKSFGNVDFTVAATNVFNQVSGPFTYYGGGVPYQGLYASQTGTYLGPYQTDRLFVQPAAVRFVLTVKT
jgi:outer membrane cobalamin receptor